MNSRRDFIVKAISLASLPVVLVLSGKLFAQEKKKKKVDAAAGSTTGNYAVPGKGLPATVKYVEDKSKVAAADQTAKQGIPFAAQNCGTCVLYSAGTACGKAEAVCTLFQAEKANMVKASAWCTSWAQNINCKS